ncbi:MAG: toll/interleukin-1 receptor domain-containing protein [Thiolinea sp.]
MLQASPQFNYDVFISYRSTQRDWAEMLANNLSAQGYKVFFDIWEIQAGQSFTRVIEEALRSSHMAILIATPEAADSGWVQREYELMLQLEREIPNFRFIPAVWGIFPDFPFLSNRHAVDFKTSTEGEYRTAFQQLLAALKQQAPGAKPYFASALELPKPLSTQAPILAAKQRNFVETIFNYLDQSLPIMVLAQEGFSTQHYVQALKTKALQRYGAQHFIHLFPPTSTQVNQADYFARLAQQAGLQGTIHASWQWADALEQRLQQGQELFVLVTGFENGAEASRREFASELRGLLERYPYELHLLILGGERLAAMKYEQGALSFLNKLEEIHLPSVCIEDLKSIYLSSISASIPDATLQQVLDFSGQHPRLVQACLRELEQGSSAWREAVQNSHLPAQLFSGVSHETELCAYLNKEQFGLHNTWSQDRLERALYWQNLLMPKNGRLVWRCEWLRNLGKELLQC